MKYKLRLIDYTQGFIHALQPGTKAMDDMDVQRYTDYVVATFGAKSDTGLLEVHYTFKRDDGYEHIISVIPAGASEGCIMHFDANGENTGTAFI